MLPVARVAFIQLQSRHLIGQRAELSPRSGELLMGDCAHGGAQSLFILVPAEASERLLIFVYGTS